MPRSGSDISAIFASASLSPSAPPESARRRSLRVSFIAARSSSESKLDTLALVVRADFFLSLMAVPPVRKTSHLDGPDFRDRLSLEAGALHRSGGGVRRRALWNAKIRRPVDPDDRATGRTLDQFLTVREGPLSFDLTVNQTTSSRFESATGYPLAHRQH